MVPLPHCTLLADLLTGIRISMFWYAKMLMILKMTKSKTSVIWTIKNFARHSVINYSAILTDTLATTKNFKALKAGSTENTRKGSMSMLQKSKMNRLRTTLKNVFNI